MNGKCLCSICHYHWNFWRTTHDLELNLQRQKLRLSSMQQQSSFKCFWFSANLAPIKRSSVSVRSIILSEYFVLVRLLIVAVVLRDIEVYLDITSPNDHTWPRLIQPLLSPRHLSYFFRELMSPFDSFLFLQSNTRRRRWPSSYQQECLSRLSSTILYSLK